MSARPNRRPAAKSPKRAKKSTRRSPPKSSAPAKPKRTRATDKPARHNVFVLSDSTGNLAQHTISALLTQFPPDTFRLHYQTFLKTREQLDDALEAATTHPAALVVHALVDASAKRRVADACDAAKIVSHDLTGELMNKLTSAAGVKPSQDAERLHRVNEHYKRRIGAMEFTLQHDDGLGLDTLAEADVILVGVSRTSKTPTSIYLAQMGYRAANYALAMEVEPPEQVLALPKAKVCGLLIDPLRLSEIRLRRQHNWKMTAGDYNELDRVEAELTWSRRLFNKMGWRSINVTNYAVEETAARIVELLKLPRLGVGHEDDEREHSASEDLD